MNNTSAYANVLLKTPALKTAVATPAAVTPKHDYKNDDTSADFHQTFKNVHDSQKSQDDRVHKSTNPKKPTQVEHHNDAKNTKAIKELKATNDTVAKQKSADDSADMRQTPIGSEVVREQPAQHKNICVDKSSDGESAQEVTNLVNDINPDPSQNTLMALNTPSGVDIGITQASLAFNAEVVSAKETLVPIIAEVSATVDKPITAQETSASAGINAASTPIESVTTISPLLVKPAAVEGGAPVAASFIATEVIAPTTLVSPLSAKSESVTTSDLIAVVPVEPNTITLETENLANVLPTIDSSVKAEKIVEVVSQPLMVNESLLEKNLSQPLADNTLATSINQPTNPAKPADAQVLAASVMASAAPVKPLQPQVALAEMSELSDEVIELLTPSVTEASVSAKSASASSLATNHAGGPEVTTAQVQMNASKSAFEKTLQSIVSPDAGGADDIATPLLNSSSTSSTMNPLMDSLMRGADQQSPAARSFVVQTAVPVPVGQPQWSQAVGEKVLWLAAQNVSSAEINLHPKDLGPMQVRVSVNQEQTTVSFTSQHAVVREVLDQNLNRLRDMFSEQGLNLVNVDVSDKSFSRQQGDAQSQKGHGTANDVAQDEETAVAMSAIVQQRLVDHYA